MQDGRHHALAGKPIERPEQYAVELALMGALGAPMLGTTTSSASMSTMRVAGKGAGDQGSQTVRGAIRRRCRSWFSGSWPVVGRDPSVDSYAHLLGLRVRIGYLQKSSAFCLSSRLRSGCPLLRDSPLRGPDEIAQLPAHGELLPGAEIDGRNRIFVERQLHNQLHFFKAAGMVRRRQRRMTNRTMSLLSWRSPAPKADPVAYIPYIVADIRSPPRLRQ